MTLITLAEEIAASIQAEFGDYVEVEVAFDPVIAEPTGLVVNDRKVFVIPMPDGVEFREASDRANDRHVYKIGIVYFVRFAGSIKAPAEFNAFNAFVKEKIEDVDANIYSLLKDKTYMPLASGSYMESINWRTVYNPDYLREYGIFWSEIDYEYAFDEPSETS